MCAHVYYTYIRDVPVAIMWSQRNTNVKTKHNNTVNKKKEKNYGEAVTAIVNKFRSEKDAWMEKQMPLCTMYIVHASEIEVHSIGISSALNLNLTSKLVASKKIRGQRSWTACAYSESMMSCKRNETGTQTHSYSERQRGCCRWPRKTAHKVHKYRNENVF